MGDSGLDVMALWEDTGGEMGVQCSFDSWDLAR
jgi:hypothetical protein